MSEQKTEVQRELVGRIVSYVLYRRYESGESQAAFRGTLSIDSVYAKGQPRSAIELLDYMTRSAVEDAVKCPGFVENYGDSAEDFFIMVQYEFVL